MSELYTNQELFENDANLGNPLKDFYKNSKSFSNSSSNSFSKNFMKTFLKKMIYIFHLKVNLLNLIIFYVKNANQFQK